jgi:anion exchange protein
LVYAIWSYVQVVVLPPGEWDPTIRLEPPKHIPSAEEMKKSYSHPPLPSAIDKDKQHGHGQHQHPAEGAGSGDGNGGGRGRGGDVNGSAMADRSKESADDGVDPTLKRTGRWFGGLVADVKRKAKVYKSDFTDIFSLQIISSIIFIYFAVISPAITFGGLMGEKTHNYQAAFESVLSVFITGVVWSFTAGQPLIKLGPTGPMLVFEEILYSFCKDQDNLDYLSFRFWIGVWTTILCLILVATDASALVQYVTRFTEETFSVLISLIFIYEALKKLVEIGIDYDFEPCVDCNITCDCISTKNGSSLVMFTAVESKNLCKAFGIANNLTMENKCPDHFREVFFLSILLMFGTFFMVTCLKSFKETPYFSSRARQIISDYSVIIAIMVWLVVDIIFDANTPKLTVPDEFRPTLHLKRGFVVNPVPSGFPAWAIFAAILPALLLTMLVFMDQQITAIIVNRKENKLKVMPRLVIY